MRKRIVLTPRGSDGDVCPFVSIASAFASRGHEVTVATAPVHQNKVERAGIRFARVRPDFPTPTGLYPEGLFDPKRSLEFFVRRILLPYLEDSYTDLLPPCRDADLIVSHPISFAAPIIAEQLRTPWVSIVLQPMLFFSTIDPPYLPTFSWLYPLRKFGTWPYAAVWRLQRATLRHWADPIHSLRRKLGLGTASGNPLMDYGQSPMCLGTLAAFSREFARERADWPQPTWLTGFVWPDSGRTLSKELQDFLAKGAAPIVFTLGDSTARVPSEFFARSLEAARRLGAVPFS